MVIQPDHMIPGMIIMTGLLLVKMSEGKKRLPALNRVPGALLGVMLAVLIGVSNAWGGDTFYVDPANLCDSHVSSCYTTIQSAVDAAMSNYATSPGRDTVKIFDGTYNESVGIPYTSFNEAEAGLEITTYTNPALNLGYDLFMSSNSFVYSNTWFDNNHKVIIDNQDKKSNKAISLISTIAAGFSVANANEVYGINLTLRNLQIKGYNVGIFIKGIPSATILAPSPYGGYKDSGQLITNCRVTGFGKSKEEQGHGIALWGGSSPRIKYCDISCNYDGIAVSDQGSMPKIVRNYIYLNTRNGVAVRASASPMIGGYGPGQKTIGQTNDIFANYIGVGCRDNASATIRNNRISGDFYDYLVHPWIKAETTICNGAVYLDQYRHPLFLPDFDENGLQLGIAGRDSSTSWIYGNTIKYMNWAGIAGQDKAFLSIGNASTTLEPILSKNKNNLSDNSLALKFEEPGNQCNNNMPMLGRASIAIRDNASAWVWNNNIAHGSVGIGARDYSTVQIAMNTLNNNNKGIAISEINPVNGITSYIYSNKLYRNGDAVVVKDSGSAASRIIVAGNNILYNGNSSEGIGIGIDHSFVSLKNNDVYNNGNTRVRRGSGGIGIRNMSDVVIVRNRVFNNEGPGMVCTGSTVTVLENLFAENIGRIAAQVWITDGSTAKKINNNAIIGNFYIEGGLGPASEDEFFIDSYVVEVSNLSLLEEARNNIFYGFGVNNLTITGILNLPVQLKQAAVYINKDSLGEALPDSVDNNIAATYVYSGTNPGPKNIDVRGAGGSWRYEVNPNEAYVLWNSEIGTLYPGPNTQWFGASQEVNGVLENIFVNAGDSGGFSRDWHVNESSPIASLTNSSINSDGSLYPDYIGLPNQFDYGLANSRTYLHEHNLTLYSNTVGSDTDPPELRISADPLENRTYPLPDSTVSSSTDITTYLMDNGDGILKDSIDMTVDGATVIDNGVASNGSSASVLPDLATSSNYELSFIPSSTFTPGAPVKVIVTAADATGNVLDSTVGSYLLNVENTGVDTTGPALTSVMPVNSSGDTLLVDKAVSFYLNDAGVGIDSSTIQVTVNNLTDSTTAVLDPIDNFIDNTDGASYLIRYKPESGDFGISEDSFLYSKNIRVDVMASDFDGNSLTDSLTFTTSKDIVPPEDITLMETKTKSSKSIKLTWNPSVNSEGDLERIIISKCLDTTLTNCSLYTNSAGGWIEVGTLSNAVGANIIGNLNDTKVEIPNLIPTMEDEFYWFMMETEDETGARSDKSDDFSDPNYGIGTGVNEWTNSNGEMVWREDSAFDLLSGPTCDFRVVSGEVALGPGDADGQLMLHDYAVANLIYEAKVKVSGAGVGYLVFRHNVNSDTGSMFSEGLNSGYVAYIKQGEAGLKIVPDTMSGEEGCNFYDDSTWLSQNPPSTISNVGGVIQDNTYYRMKVVAIRDKIVLEVYDESGQTLLGKTDQQTNRRYTFGEVGFYRGNEGGSVVYDDVNVTWLGVVGPLNTLTEGAQIAGGFFEDDFTGLMDDFSGGDLTTKWAESGTAGFSVTNAASVYTLTNNSASEGELIAYDFNPGDKFKVVSSVLLENNGDEANIIFNKQLNNGVGDNTYIAHVDRGASSGTISLLLTSPDGSITTLASNTNANTSVRNDWNMSLTANQGTLDFSVESSAGTYTYNLSTTDTTFLKGKVGILHPKGANSVKFTSFEVNDLVEENWETQNTTGWTITGNAGRNKNSINEDVMMAARGFLMPPSFEYSADVTFVETTNLAPLYMMLQKNDTDVLNNRESYALSITPDSVGSNIYLVKLNSLGNAVSTLSNIIDYPFTKGTTVHVAVMGTSSHMACDDNEICSQGSYAFKTYLSTSTGSRPYNYDGEFYGIDPDSGNLLTRGRAGFGVWDSSSDVSIDNVVMGRVNAFNIGVDSINGTSVGSTYLVNGPYPTAAENYASIQNNISLANLYAQANPMNSAVVTLGAGEYSIGNNTIYMLDKVALVGQGMNLTTLSNSGAHVINIDMNSKNNLIEDLTVMGNGSTTEAGIWIIDSAPMIRKVRVRDCWDGIRIGGGLHVVDETEFNNNPARPTITMCEIVHNLHIGIGNNVMSEAWIYNNYVDDNDYVGIGVKDLAEPRIEENRIGSSGDYLAYRDGYVVLTPNGPTIANSVVPSNPWSPGNGNAGLGIQDYTEPYIVRNTLVNNAVMGISVRGNASPWISDNVVKSNGNFGIIAYEDSAPLILRNKVANHNDAGLSFMSDTNTVTPEIRLNRVEKNRNGIRAMGGVAALIEGNYVYSTYGQGKDQDGGIMMMNKSATLTLNNSHLFYDLSDTDCTTTAHQVGRDCSDYGYDLNFCYNTVSNVSASLFCSTLAESVCGSNGLNPDCTWSGGACVGTFACNIYDSNIGSCNATDICMYDTTNTVCSSKYECSITYDFNVDVEHSPEATITNNWVFNGKSNGIGFRGIQKRATGYSVTKPVYKEVIQYNNVNSNVFRGIGIGVENSSLGRAGVSNNSADYSIANNCVGNNGRAGVALRFTDGDEIIISNNTITNNVTGIASKYNRGTGSFDISGNYVYNNVFTSTAYYEDTPLSSNLIYTERPYGRAGGVALLNPSTGLAINIKNNYIESNKGWVYSEGVATTETTLSNYFNAGGIGLRLTEGHSLNGAGKVSITNNTLPSNKGHSVGIRGGRGTASSISNIYVAGNTVRNAYNGGNACAVGFRDQAIGTIVNNVMVNIDHAVGFDDVTFSNNTDGYAYVSGNSVENYSVRGIGVGTFNNAIINGTYSIMNNTVKNGTDGVGVAINTSGAAMFLSGNLICSNTNVNSSGQEVGVVGGIGMVNLLGAADVKIDSNSLRNNSGQFSGGIGISLSNGQVSISNNYLFSNEATSSINSGNGAGIGIRNSSASVWILKNTINRHQ